MRRAYPYTEILSNAARGKKPFTRRSLLLFFHEKVVDTWENMDYTKFNLKS